MRAAQGTDGPRYAIYFVPTAETALYRFGSAVLGYDCYSGERVPHPELDRSLSAAWLELTRTPRKYGFHATLTAPFRLVRGAAESELVAQMNRLASIARPIASLEPVVAALGSFVAIVPRVQLSELDDIAAACVTEFDRFRLPLTPQELQRRMTQGLSERQKENLNRWGYPYVFNDFRFHMTLTGSLVSAVRETIVELLQGMFTRRCGNSLISIDRVSLVRQDREDSPFQVVHQVPLYNDL